MLPKDKGLSAPRSRRVDLEELASEARGSEDEEAFCETAHGDGFRIGVVVRLAKRGVISISIEVLFRVLGKGRESAVPSLQVAADIACALVHKGYDATLQDDCWTSFERLVTADELDLEQTSISTLLRERLGTKTQPSACRVTR